MGRLLVGWWVAIWPNLAANVIWVPVAGVHHVLMKRHITREHEKSRKQAAEATTSQGGTQ